MTRYGVSTLFSGSNLDIVVDSHRHAADVVLAAH
jgi:hypothetical protein